MTPKVLWPVEETMPEQLSKKQVAAEEKEWQCTDPSLLHWPSLPMGPNVTCSKETGDQNQGGERCLEGSWGVFTECLFVCPYFSILESIISFVNCQLTTLDKTPQLETVFFNCDTPPCIAQLDLFSYVKPDQERVQTPDWGYTLLFIIDSYI